MPTDVAENPTVRNFAVEGTRVWRREGNRSANVSAGPVAAVAHGRTRLERQMSCTGRERIGRDRVAVGLFGGPSHSSRLDVPHLKGRCADNEEGQIESK